MELGNGRDITLLQGPFVAVPSVPTYMADYASERKLVKAAKDGNRDAFERILDICQDKVYSLVRRMVGAGDAEDVAQEALIELCKSITSFQGRSSISTWAYRIAVNVCLEHRRRNRPEVVSFDEDFADPADDPSDAAVKTELRSDVASAISTLPEFQRDVVVLHEMQGLTYQECAEVLGCPVGTVKSRLANAFVKLREMLKEHASEGGLVK